MPRFSSRGKIQAGLQMKRGYGTNNNPRIGLARLARLERATYGFEVRRSIHLSYRRGESRLIVNARPA